VTDTVWDMPAIPGLAVDYGLRARADTVQLRGIADNVGGRLFGVLEVKARARASWPGRRLIAQRVRAVQTDRRRRRRWLGRGR
jgi:hypothetical protein